MSHSSKNLQFTNYTLSSVSFFSDLDEKYRKRDRYGGGMITEFKDKEGYKPEIRLEYVDDSGRCLNPKEAFRQLSHRFHGKGSGKKKTEKRQKKVEEEQVCRIFSFYFCTHMCLQVSWSMRANEELPWTMVWVSLQFYERCFCENIWSRKREQLSTSPPNSLKCG